MGAVARAPARKGNHGGGRGHARNAGGGYPRELSGVATNLNTLLIGERNRLSRYRDTLGNLAHSLKTPLAVMRSTLLGVHARDHARARRRNRSHDRDHRAPAQARSASGGALLGQAPLEIEPLVAELRAALMKVYARKDLSIELVGRSRRPLRRRSGDLMELLGNVLDNACKWCRGTCG